MIGIISDLHFKPNLSYSDYVEDNRKGEEKEILDFIVKSLKGCNKIVFVGDLLNGRNNSSEVLRRLVRFIERFEDKNIYIISGTHEKSADGRTSLDFLKEIKNPKWKIITDKVEEIDGMVFCPTFTKPELKAKNNEDGRKKLMKMLPDGNILFTHYSISGSHTSGGVSTDIFDEIVLDRKGISKKYNLVVSGHIHSPDYDKNIVITGSIFMNEVNEDRKSIWMINENNYAVKEIKVPGRNILKIENPTDNDFKEIEKSSIVKVILTDPKLKCKINDIKEKLKKFDAFILLEQFPKERKKIHFEEGMLEFSIEELLGIYAKQKKVDIKKIKTAFELIK